MTFLCSAKAALSRWAFAGGLFVSVAAAAPLSGSLPAQIDSPDAMVVMTAHGVGAQIYECVNGSTGLPGWRFREPIAALMVDGHTIGRHFVGPTWELDDGSQVAGKVAASVPGATAEDIPWLRLEIVKSRSVGQLATVSVIQRINTTGGMLTGSCPAVGNLIAVPYVSDYVFLTKK